MSDILKKYEKAEYIPIQVEEDLELWQTLGQDLVQDETPNATNESGAREHVEERKKYKVLYEELSVPAPIDLWGGKRHYGRIDVNGNVIIPIPESMTLMTNDIEQEQHRAFDFVVDAFREFQTYYKLSRMRGLVFEDKNPKLDDIQPYKGWEDPVALYKMHLDDLKEGFINRIASQRDINAKSNARPWQISNFNDFVRFVEDDLINMGNIQQIPLTLEGFIKSSFCDIMNTGLAIEIDDQGEHADDAYKYENYVSDMNFPFYVKAALRFGFRVDSNAPWRLVADFFSQEMIEYYTKRITSKASQVGTLAPVSKYTTPAGSVFDFSVGSWSPIHIQAPEFLGELMYNSYSSLLERSPIYKTSKLTKVRTVSKLVERKPLTKEQFKKQYPFDYWAKFWLKAKMHESNEWNEKMYKDIVKRVDKMKKVLDKDAIMMYINSRFKKCPML